MSRALVIEDNENNMRLITFLLQKNGYEHIWAPTGREGVEMAFTEQPDFIILDIQLPDIDGTQVLREIRTREQKLDRSAKLPIIAMTSYAMSGDRERLLAAGCTGYIEKPIDPMVVIDQLKEIIGDAV